MDLYSDVYQVSSRESFSNNMKPKIGKAYMQNKRLLTLNKMMSSKPSKPVPTVPIYPVNRFNSTIPPILSSPPLKKDEAQILEAEQKLTNTRGSLAQYLMVMAPLVAVKSSSEQIESGPKTDAWVTNT